MYNFTYSNPEMLSDAEHLLGTGESPTLLAGGQTLLPTLKLRLAQHSSLVDLGRIVALKGIVAEGSCLRIGAMTTHWEVASSATVAAAIPALSQLAGMIGDPQVRHRGTIGGSVANNDPSADYPAGCLGLGATIHTNRRDISADDFFVGMFETALENGEIITALSFPVPEVATYVKYPNPASRYALVGVMVSKGVSGIRVAVTGAGNAGVFRDTAIEAALQKNFVADAVPESGVSEDTLMSDMHAAADYRKHLIAVMARRAVAAATS